MVHIRPRPESGCDSQSNPVDACGAISALAPCARTGSRGSGRIGNGITFTGVAETITRVLMERRKQTDGEVAAAAAEGRRLHHDDILEKVRRFFGLS